MGRKTSLTPPIAVKRSLRKLGSDLRDARRRRRIPTALMAERVGVTRATLAKAEKGSSSVSIGVYASMLFVLGLVERLSEIADPRQDDLGLALEEERLPKRIRTKRSKDKP
ncbi:MAG: helix-turn-helix domain-containing protein [Planctomycetota bacterium]|nr:helix-turn-helix domain-containing protein [Planctomycetota bacterium]